jgi:hypothetical protein
MFMSLLCALISAVAAQTEIRIPDALPQDILTAIIMIILGLAATFFGLRLFRPMLFLAGFIFFAVIAYASLARIENISELWLYIGTLVLAIVGGSITCTLISKL